MGWMTRISQICGGLGLLLLACVSSDDTSDVGNDTTTSSGDGDGDGDGTSNCDDTGDGDYPGTCSCEAPDAPCFQACTQLDPDAPVTCTDVCASIGKTCVENGCNNSTVVGGAEDCPAPGDFGSFYDQPCDQALPESDTPASYDCCCTRT
jgi:hypothetical protein